jgi:heme-degrading monooxygenase HmoA
MYARVMSTNLKKATIDEAGREWRSHIEPYKKSGMKKAYMLVDRATGKYLSITIWESEDAQKKNAGSPEQKAGREAMTAKYFEGPPQPSAYEVLEVIE